RKAQGKNEYVYDDFWDEVEKCFPTWQALETPGGYAFLSQWGSARYNTAMQLIALVYDKYNNDGKPSEYSDWAKGQMEYIMGNNPLGRSYIVGYNENSAKYPHHRACSGLTKCEDPDEHRYVLYGALVGGPDGNDQHIDKTSDYIYNEVTIDYNAAFVGACAGLYAYYGTDDMKVTPDFPPAVSFEGETGGNNYWVNACGIDDLNSDGCGVTKVSLMVMTDSIKPAKDISVRYYFNSSEISDVNNVKASELYDQAAVEASPADGVISGPYKYDKTDDTYYIEIKWDGYTIANSNKKYQFTVGMYYGDKWNPENDPSYKDLKIYDTDDAFFGTGNEVKTDNICVYSDGVFVGGIEPDGSVPEKSEPTTESNSEILWGDANADGSVDVADAVAVASYVGDSKTNTLTAQGLVNADVHSNGNGINANDALVIQQYLANKLTELPA
ncbi:MAG: glycoside hydrolase family 9 protein, partial [Bacteroides sp.]